ncbi:hypothetical protein K4K96_00935 [Phaeobacter inhibens]|uniref:Imm10 family immunity protein n=1 Tax=Phaeobacter inhibens TaxID=221822 RepID=UPI0021A862AC|nr:Imm10 family immunity protein [Phaeobacter inhibens]UWR92655.1 hypothetical protein K4K96_00935 [Phaeobacter inhibens]
MHKKEFRHVSASQEFDHEMVAFGEATDGSTDYVLLQLETGFDHRDRVTGMDGIYLEINDQAHSGYKLVHRIEVDRNAVTIHFSPQRIGLPEAFNPFYILQSNAAVLNSDVYKTLATMADRVGVEFEHKPALE